jgi:hypothetical protein
MPACILHSSVIKSNSLGCVMSCTRELPACTRGLNIMYNIVNKFYFPNGIAQNIRLSFHMSHGCEP